MRYSLLFTFLSVCSALASPSPYVSEEPATPAQYTKGRFNPLQRGRVTRQKRDSEAQHPLIRGRAAASTVSIIPVTKTAVKTAKVAATRTVYVTAYKTATQTRTVTKTVTAVKTATKTKVVDATVLTTKKAQAATSTSKSATTTSKPATSTKATSTAKTTISATSIPTPIPTSSSVTFEGYATWFEVGLGACGNWNDDSELVVAVSSFLYDSYPGATLDNPNNNPICGKYINVTYGSQSVKAKIVDACEGCSIWNVDLSPTAFNQLADLDVGMMDVTWTWA